MAHNEDTFLDRGILDRQTRAVVEMLEQDPFLDLSMTSDEMRLAFDKFYEKTGYPTLPVARVENIEIPGNAGPISARAYYPEGSEATLKPACVFFHGGGMMMGSIDAYDGLCRRLSAMSKCIIISCSYRLAPENKFPGAVEDALSCFNWVHTNAESLGVDAERLAIAGESGGGNLAAVVTQELRDHGDSPIAYQILINPAVGSSGTSDSMKKYARGFFFEPEQLDWFFEQYLTDMSMLKSPRVSPILASSFADLPSAFVVVAGVDILRSDIEKYAELLAEAGVPVKMSTYEGTIHGFTCMGALIDAGVSAIDECAEKLRTALKA